MLAVISPRPVDAIKYAQLKKVYGVTRELQIIYKIDHCNVYEWIFQRPTPRALYPRPQSRTALFHL